MGEALDPDRHSIKATRLDVQLFLDSWSKAFFGADFVFSGSPSVYKTAALPLSYAGVH
jgi:hypothetical protein